MLDVRLFLRMFHKGKRDESRAYVQLRRGANCLLRVGGPLLAILVGHHTHVASLVLDVIPAEAVRIFGLLLSTGRFPIHKELSFITRRKYMNRGDLTDPIWPCPMR